MNPTRPNLAFVLCGLLAGLTWLGAWGKGAAPPKDAIVVLSREAEPFRKCEKAATLKLRAAGWAVKSVVMDEKGNVPGADAAGRIIAIGTEAATWAKGRASESVNVVFCMVADAEGAGLTSHPNIAGVLSEVPASAQISLIKEALPNAGTVGILYKADSVRGERWLAAIRQEAIRHGLAVDAQSVESKDKLGPAVVALLKRKISVLWTMPDGGLYDANTLKAVLRATLEERVPVFGFSTPVVRAGALAGVGIAPESQGVQSAALLIERAERQQPLTSRIVDPDFEVGVNLVVAERLQLSIPAAFLQRATQVFNGE